MALYGPTIFLVSTTPAEGPEVARPDAGR